MTEPTTSARDYIRSRAPEELLVWLALGDPSLRRKAARELGRRGELRAVPRLVELLDAAEPLVREAAADALGGIPLPDAERAAVAEKIAHLMVQEGQPVTVRNTCAFALAKLRYPPAFDRLVSMLGDPDVSVRICAVAALAAISGPLAYEVLNNAQHAERDAYVVEQIRRALASLRSFGVPGRGLVRVAQELRGQQHVHLSANSMRHYGVVLAVRSARPTTSVPSRSHPSGFVRVLLVGAAMTWFKSGRDDGDHHNALPDETGLRLPREAVS